MRRLPLTLAALVLATGCGPETHLDLRLRAVAITVPRLVTPAVVLVPPATTPPPVSLPPLPPLVLPPPVVAPPTSAPPIHFDPPMPPACPKAKQLDVPEKPAAVVVASTPAAGSYTQAATGAYSAGGKAGSLAGTVGVAVTPLPTQTTSAGQKVDAWKVTRTGPGTSVEVYRLVHPSTSPLATAAGIYLVGLAWDDPVRGTVTLDTVGDGVFILPSPVAQATNDTQYVGAATDPDTLTTLELTRNVRDKKQVDACGALIDTYTVEMSGTLTSPDAQYTVTWTQQLATAYGAADVEDSFTLSSPTDGLLWTRVLHNTALPKDVS